MNNKVNALDISVCLLTPVLIVMLIASVVDREKAKDCFESGGHPVEVARWIHCEHN